MLDVVPDGWLVDEPRASFTPDEVRAAYVDVLATRVADPQAWLDAVEVLRAAG